MENLNANSVSPTALDRSGGSAPNPWPPSRFDLDQSLAWADMLAEARCEGEDAMTCVLAWEVRRLRAALDAVRTMAEARKSCIRMPDGRMLDNFCRMEREPNGRGETRREKE